MTTSRRGGRRPGAGRKPGRMPRLSKEEAKALLKTLVPEARSSADYARAFSCRPERIREALRQGCTVKCANSWRATQISASTPVEEAIRIACLEGARMMQAAAAARCREVSARADARGAVGGTQQETDIAVGAHRCRALVEALDPAIGSVVYFAGHEYECIPVAGTSLHAWRSWQGTVTFGRGAEVQVKRVGPSDLPQAARTLLASWDRDDLSLNPEAWNDALAALRAAVMA